MDFFKILELLGGLALFLYGLDVMGDGLKKISGSKLKNILGKLTSNKFKGFLLGLVVTAAVQSSSATTVMLIGFVNSGIMRVGQTISIIMGANIGTTVTGWILSLSAVSGDSFIIRLIQPSSFIPILAAAGIIMIMTAKKERKKYLGSILIGFSVLMYGMQAMSGAMSVLKESESFSKLLIMFSNPVMGIVSGTLLTAVLQSSSASIGILQALSQSGLIPVSTALPIILGQNVGDCITPLISSVNGNTDAKRVSVACFYIKFIRVVIFAAVFYGLNAVFDFSFMKSNASPFNIALIHTTFNIVTVAVLMPFCSWIEKLAVMTVKDGKANKENEIFDALDERFLSIPSFAVEKSRQLVCEMANITRDSLIESTALIENYDKSIVEKILASEDEVDKFEDKISSYLVKLSGKELSTADNREVTELLHCIGDIERISDHAVNILQVAEEINDKKIKFSDEAVHDIRIITDAVCEVTRLATEALTKENLAVAKKVEPLEQVIDKLKFMIKTKHIERLKDGDCTVEDGFTLSDLLVNYERVSDHCSNIAVCLLEGANDSFETHEYLSNVKYKGENDFFDLYEGYKNKYSLE